TAPTRPIAMAGPATGISALAAAAAPSSAPVAAPTAPPMTPPTALPIPGCSASLVGSVATSSPERPGTKTRIRFGDRPAARTLAAALSAAARSEKIPIVGLIREPPFCKRFQGDGRQEACHERETVVRTEARDNPSGRTRDRVILIEQKCSAPWNDRDVS